MDAQSFFFPCFFLIKALAFCSSIQIIGPLLDFAVISPACLSPRGEEGLRSLGLVGREMENIANVFFQDSLCLPAGNLSAQTGIWQAPGELSGCRQNVLKQCSLGFLSSNHDSCQAETCSSSCGMGGSRSLMDQLFHLEELGCLLPKHVRP